VADTPETRPVDSVETLPNWVLPWPPFRVDWAKAALLVVDYQNYGSNPRCGTAKMIAERFPEVGEYYCRRITKITIPNSRRLLDAFRAAPIIAECLLAFVGGFSLQISRR
jgi:hypothetical protein